MNNKKIILIAFALIALVQMYLPAKMILDRENVIQTGTEYKFRTAPVDPNDPFRGKYITLDYTVNSIKIPKNQNWREREKIYVSLSTDSTGFAKIKSVSKEEPINNKPFVKAEVSYISGNMLVINYPFDRFYMEESKAYDAELAYRESQRDTVRVTYALVSIKGGDAVLKDVLIGGISIQKLASTEILTK
jgi:uncharacterized membrane-anchored protein